jgi:hypothetical protein
MAGLKALHAADPDKFTYSDLSKKFGISYEAVNRILKSSWRDKVARGEVSSTRENVDWENEARPATRESAMAFVKRDMPEEVEEKTLRGTKWDTSPELGETYSPVPAITRAMNRSRQGMVRTVGE